MNNNLPRGIRNNNPGNIRISSDPWKGLAENQVDGAFFNFESSEYGIRALIINLRSYQDKHNLNTIEGIINRWAPTTENNTSAYVQAVSKRTGFSSDKELDMYNVEHVMPLVKAIIQHENGQQPYADAEIKGAFELAGPGKSNYVPQIPNEVTRNLAGVNLKTTTSTQKINEQKIQKTEEDLKALAYAATGLKKHVTTVSDPSADPAREEGNQNTDQISQQEGGGKNTNLITIVAAFAAALIGGDNTFAHRGHHNPDRDNDIGHNV